MPSSWDTEKASSSSESNTKRGANGKVFVGIDLYYSELARKYHLYGLVIDDIWQFFTGDDQSGQSLKDVQVFVCFHAVNTSLPLILDTDIQTTLRDKGMVLLFPTQKETFCGERYLSSGNTDSNAETRSITDFILQTHPHLSASSGKLVILKDVNLCVVMDNDNGNDSDNNSDSYPLSNGDEALFDWHFYPSPGANIPGSGSSNSSSSNSNVICAFHYPMDGTTLYPATWDNEQERSVPFVPLPVDNDGVKEELLPYATYLYLFVKIDNSLLATQDPDNPTLVLTFTSLSLGLNFEFPPSLVSPNFGYIMKKISTKRATDELYRTADLRMTLRNKIPGADVIDDILCSQRIEFFLAQQPYEMSVLAGKEKDKDKETKVTTEVEVEIETGAEVEAKAEIPTVHMSALAQAHPPTGLLMDSSRADFPSLLRYLRMGQDDVTVEIGTFVGTFSRVFLDRWVEGGTHLCVDPWEQSDQYLDCVNDEQTVQDLRYLEALETLKTEGSRLVVLRTTGVQAASIMAPLSISFVFVDGDHSYVAAMQDMRAWWPKLRWGGVLAGHDFDFKGNVT